MRTAGAFSTLLLAGAFALGQGAPVVHNVAEVGFDNVWGAWATLRESSFGRKLAASGWLDRVGVNRHRAQVRAALVQAETHLGMPLTEPLSEVLRGKGVLVIAEENGSAVFVLDLRPAGDVPFRALLDRLLARDPEVVRVGDETVGGRAFERIRVKEKEILVRIEEQRFLAGDSRALLAVEHAVPAIAPGACLQARFFPGAARALPEHRNDAPMPITRIDCALEVTGERVALSGTLECTDEWLLEPFAKVAAEPSALRGLLPEGGMAFAMLRADLKALHRLVERCIPAAERELFRRRTVGFSYTALGGRMLPDVLAGLGPEVLVAVAGLEGSAQPAAFALLTPIRTKEAREAMSALGCFVYGMASLSKGEARKDAREGLSFFTGKIGELEVTFGVRDDLLCVSTSESMAKAVCASTAATGGGGAAVRLAGHMALGVDPVALGAWLRRNKEMLSTRPTWQQGFRRPDEIEGAAEFSSVLSNVSCAAVVKGATVDFSLGLDFARP
jgi:hypothetical protein